MSKTIKMTLGTSDINNLINSLTTMTKNINNLGEEITRELSVVGSEYLTNEYSDVNDPNIDPINVSTRKTSLGYDIVANGDSLFYEEFGTGDEGESVSGGKGVQEARSKFNLKNYNSGDYIRDANSKSKEYGIVSGKYWTYKKNGEIYHTQGVKPGLEVYNTSQFLKNKAVKDVMKKKAGDVISKV